MELAAGARVTDKVRLVAPLGEGGMGSVWVADHLTLETRVAVKFMSPELARRPELLARFKREAATAARLGSPHVVRVFDHGTTDDGTPYIVMEKLRGESLGAHIQRRGPIALGDTARIVSQVASVLGEAHAAGIIHRDLKPENLFLIEAAEQPFVKVLDFGIAKRTDAEPHSVATATGATMGTPAYMSPEQLMGGPILDHRMDLWALAVVAYTALTAAHPFRGETPTALAFSICKGLFRPPRSLVPALPPQLDAWFKIALCRDIDARYASAVELAAELRRAARGEEPAVPEIRAGPAGETPGAGGASPPADPTAEHPVVESTLLDPPRPSEPRIASGHAPASADVAESTVTGGHEARSAPGEAEPTVPSEGRKARTAPTGAGLASATGAPATVEAAGPAPARWARGSVLVLTAAVVLGVLVVKLRVGPPG
jgi:serine/threonine-protein kinase